MEENVDILSVSDINRIIKNDLASNPNLFNVYVCGEVSRIGISKGVAYFTLKDEYSEISAQIWPDASRNLKFPIQSLENKKIVAYGNISLYEKKGTYSLRIINLALAGHGELYLRLEQLREELTKEGFFLDSHKKKIPYIPKTIGVITKYESAAFADVYKTLNSRFPFVNLLVYSCSVQGEKAKYEICDMIERANYDNYCDVLILCRGGGSIEDLWQFNERMVVEAVYNSEIPIIVGVGHEIDHTLCEYAADVIAPTPTGAAILAVPSKIELLENLDRQESYLIDLKTKLTKNFLSKLKNLHQMIESLNPKEKLKLNESKVEDLSIHLDNYINNNLIKFNNALIVSKSNFETLSPENKLKLKKETISNLEAKLDNVFKEVSVLKNHNYERLLNYFDNYTFDKTFKHYNNVLNNFDKDLNIYMNNEINKYNKHLNNLDELLNSYSPMNVLVRGYTITKKDNKIIKSVDDVKENDTIVSSFKDGVVISVVKEKKNVRK